MTVQINAILIGVGDMDRAKQFYSEGLGCQIDKDYSGYFSDPDGHLWKVATSS